MFEKTIFKFGLFVCIPLFIVAYTLSRWPYTFIAVVHFFPPPVVEVGDDMVDANLIDINGKKQRLSDYSGKYLLLNFWSRNCGSSTMALSEMKEVSENYRENLTGIGINVDANTGWKEATSRYDISWVNFRDRKGHGGLAAKYGSDLTVPYFVIISPDGKIVDKWFRSEGSIEEKVSKTVK